MCLICILEGLDKLIIVISSKREVRKFYTANTLLIGLVFLPIIPSMLKSKNEIALEEW